MLKKLSNSYVFSLVKAFTFCSALSGCAKDAYNPDHIKPTSPEIYKDAIQAANDPKILAACPQLTEVQLQSVAMPPSSDEDKLKYNIARTELINGKIGNKEDILEGIEPYKHVSQALYSLNYDEKIVITIDSNGGYAKALDALAQSINDTKGTVIIDARNRTSSAASALLALGSEDYRYVNRGTSVIIHATRVYNIDPSNPDLISPDTETAFEEDFKPNSRHRFHMAISNSKLKNYYIKASSTNISYSCIDELINGKTDVQVLPEDMVRLGLADAAYDLRTRSMLVRQGWQHSF